MDEETSSSKKISGIRFIAYLNDGSSVELDLFQYVMLNGSIEIQQIVVSNDHKFAKSLDYIEALLFKAIVTGAKSEIAEIIFRNYLRFYNADVLLENIMKFVFRKLTPEKNLDCFRRVASWMNDMKSVVDFQYEFNTALSLLIEEEDIKKEFITSEYLDRFFEILDGWIDCNSLISSHSEFELKGLKAFRSHALRRLNIDDENKEFLRKCLRNSELNDSLFYDISLILVSDPNMRIQVREIVARKIALCLTGDIYELNLNENNLREIKKILKLIFPSIEECAYLLNFIDSLYQDSKISAYNPEIFDLVSEHLKEVDPSESMTLDLKRIIESKYPDILFRDENLSSEQNKDKNKKLNQKKRKRPDEEELTDIRKESDRKRRKIELPLKPKREMLREYLRYWPVEKAFENSSMMNLKEVSNSNLSRLKIQIMEYICTVYNLNLENNPKKFFSVLQNHEALAEIFCMLMGLDLKAYHFSDVDIKDSIMSHDMLKEREINFYGFTNKDDIKTGNTGYVFACASFCFDGVATSFNIHSFLDADTRYLYQTDFQRIEALPYSVLTMQDWAMYNESTVYTARVSNELIARVKFIRRDDEIFVRDKIIELEHRQEGKKVFIIPRSHEVFYGREISIGLALSTIRVLTMLGEEMIKDLHRNLSTTNLSNFIATFMPLELKIPHEIPISICNKVDKITNNWSDMVVTPHNR